MLWYIVAETQTARASDWSRRGSFSCCTHRASLARYPPPMVLVKRQSQLLSGLPEATLKACKKEMPC